MIRWSRRSVVPAISKTGRRGLSVESFEQLCRVVLEAERFVVTGNVKFPVRRKTSKKDRDEYQTHGYELDLVGARGDRLVLAEVKSFLGSRGVGRQGFRELAGGKGADDSGQYKLFNDVELRDAIVAQACERFGYRRGQVEIRLYVGKFAGGHEQDVRAHLAAFEDPRVRVVGLEEITGALVTLGRRGTYIDDPVIVTVKALDAAGLILDPTGPA